MKAQGLTKETILDYGVIDRGFPEFRVGDSIGVSVIVKEGDKERTQLFAGDVIDMHINGMATTFTVRRISANNIGVERIFPIHSPIIEKIELLKRGKVRRANLGYIRDRLGKSARIEEKVMTKAAKEAHQAAKDAAKASESEAA